MTRVLLTGVGGSIGCHVLAHLLDETDWHVVGLDSFRHKGLTDRVAQVVHRDHPEWLPRLTVLAHDLTAPISLVMARRIGQVDHVISMASLSDVHDSLVNPAPFVEHNVKVALTMLEFARMIKPRAFVQVSTDEVYGPTDGKHLHEEWSSIVPSNPYSASKVAQEAVATAWWRSWGVPVVIVNLMNNFGEMQSPSKFPAIVQRKVRRGETVDIHVTKGEVGSRSYIHSRNSADAILFLLRCMDDGLPPSPSMGDKPPRFNVVGDRQVNNLELARLIAGMIGRQLYVNYSEAGDSRPGHDVHYGLDGSKLASLGWQQPVPFEESMRRTVEWYEANPEWLEAR